MRSRSDRKKPKYKLRQENIPRSVQSRKRADNRELIFLCIYSVLLYMISEAIARKDFIGMLSFTLQNPFKAIVNTAVVFLPLSIALIVKRKKFVYLIVSTVVILLSITNGVLISLRGMPLFPYDIMAFKEAFSISSKFLSLGLRILLLLVVVFLICALVYLFRLEGRLGRRKSRRNIVVILATILGFGVIIPQLQNFQDFKTIAWNMGESYKKNGFDYSFARECISAYRGKPDGYSKKKMLALRTEYDKLVKEDKRKIYTGNKRPNIVIIQLEAFMDPTIIKGVKFNQDPMPHMRKLMDKYTSGTMNVPVTGGGTARTEYEVLSGSDFDFLNQGEIPYQTFLSEKPSVSLATNLKRDGYRATAIHNFYKRFYNRDKGLQSLGFEKFIPLDVMTNVEYNPVYWPKDKVLTKYIEESIGRQHEESDKNDPKFVFTISTQGHSKYPKSMTKEEREKLPIKLVDSDKISPIDKSQLEYYANQVKEMDDFVADVLKKINLSGRPTVLAMYGDHLPALNIITKNRSGLDKYQSLYVVVNNFGVKKDELKDFESNDLSTYVLKVAGQPYGPMNLVHAYSKGDKDYKKRLELIQYDILFGKKYFLKKEEYPKKTEMNINNDKLKLEKVSLRNGEYFIIGDGINRNTAVYLNGKRVDSDYYDEKTLRLYDSFYNGKQKIQLKVLDNNDKVIQESNEIEYEF